METAPLKSFATWARTALIKEVSARISVVLASHEIRQEQPKVIAALEKAVNTAGTKDGLAAVVDKVAYTWFNRIIALRFMDANGYTGIGVVSPGYGREGGQPEILAEANRGNIDTAIVRPAIETTVTNLLNGTRRSPDPLGEAYALLLEEYCRGWRRSMPFMFEREDDYTELLIPANLLTDDSVLVRAMTVLTEESCQDVEVIGWLYQFYISERKAEVFAGFKKNKLAGATEIPAATQLFTPHWVVRYLVENSLGRLWLLNRPSSRLAEQMEYFIGPNEEEADHLKVSKPEELKIIDPACGSGHMLTYAFDLLYAIYEEEGYPPSDIPGLILANNLYGAEIDPRAGALAAFALTMKARARQRKFFTKQIQPNICVLDPILFTTDDLNALVTPEGNRSEEETFWSCFENADTFGSLICPREEMIEPLRKHLDLNEPKVEDLLSDDTFERARRVILQAEYLSPRYHVVVANPPYMGSKNMGSLLSDMAQSDFPDSKSDLFAMFIERGFELLVPRGLSAMVTMQAWMFLSSYMRLRERLLNERQLHCLVHMGNSVMGIAFGTVATVWGSDQRGSETSSFSYVASKDIVCGKPHVFPVQNARLISSSTRELQAIPGSPIAYWASPALRSTFKSGVTVEDLAPVRQGFQTGDNDRFMRFWFEVSKHKINYAAKSTEDFHASGAKFAPYLKGGPLRKWYGNDEYVVAFDSESFSALSQLGNKLPSRALYFRESITWSAMSSSDFGARYAGVGSTFSAKGACAFPTDGYARDLVLAVLNSSITKDLLEFMGATMDFNVGSLRQIPLPKNVPTEQRAEIHTLVAELLEIHSDDWNSDEYSPGFQLNSVLRQSGEADLETAVHNLAARGSERSKRTTELQTRLDSIIARTYGLSSAGSSPVTLRNYLPIEPTQGERTQFVRRVVSDLVSYAVGCMFGRYSLDEPGLILADQWGPLSDYFAKVPSPTFLPDIDNVIPVVNGDWFEDDIVSRFREFLRITFGEQHFEQNLRFVTEALGVKDLRDYFVKSFYRDHVQRYKKRPIYWLFSSPKGSFNALIYMHRYTTSTVSIVLNEYLREFKAKLEASRKHHERLAADGGTPREKASALKELDRLRRTLLELDEYEHDVLYPLATRQVSMDLDDGVKANYPIFGAALKKVDGLEASDE